MKILLRLLAAFLAGALFIVLIQDVIIFPGAMTAFFNQKGERAEVLPKDTNGTFIKTEDGELLEVWKMDASGKAPQNKVIILFHGNGETLESVHHLQRWLSSIGFTNYSFDYRGYGKSTGWPSEEGIYRDSDAIFKHVIQSEKVEPSQIILFAFSIGTAPASYLAAKHEPALLIALAPFKSIPERARDTPIYKPLTPFLRYEFPTDKNIAALKATSLVIAHGAWDTIINPHHSYQLAPLYNGSGSVKTIFHPTARHNDLLRHISEEIEEILLNLG